jgi:hypothetical protein
VSVNVTPNGRGDALLKTEGWQVVRVDQHGAQTDVLRGASDVAGNGGGGGVDRGSGSAGGSGAAAVAAFDTLRVGDAHEQEMDAILEVRAISVRAKAAAEAENVQETAPPEVFIIPEVGL